MSLTDIQHVDPRVEFWSDKLRWPRNATGLIFLGQIVQHLGRAMFGDVWLGTEPCTVSVLPIRRHLSAVTPPSDIQYACQLLYENHIGFRQRTDTAWANLEPVPMPMPDEWAVAYALSERNADAARASLNRFWAVIDVLTRLFEQGIVRTWLRPYFSGDVILLKPGEWFNECYDAWFATCQIDLERPFSGRPIRYGGHRIYVDEESCLKWLALAFDTVNRDRPARADAPAMPPDNSRADEVQTTAETPAMDEAVVHDSMETSASVVSDTAGTELSARGERLKPKANRRGAPERYEWSVFDEEVVQVARSGAMPSSDRGFADRMAGWCAAEWERDPSHSTLRDRIKRVMQKNGLKMPSELAKNAMSSVE